MAGTTEPHAYHKSHDPDDGGLSPSHNRTIRGGEERIIPAAVKVYDQAALASASREQVEKACLKCGRPFKALVRRSDDKLVCRSCETVTKTCKKCEFKWHGVRWPKDGEGKPVKEFCPECGAEYRGNKRNPVTRFSENSRRRLMRLLATIRKGVLPVFVTLTYPDSWDGHSDPDAWKVTLKRFETRFRRAFPTGAYIWRQEAIDRKSGARLGEISPHFHLLVFGVDYKTLRAWVPVTWFECVATEDPKHLHAGTQVAQIKSRRGIMRYASKTMGRVMAAELGKAVQTKAGSVGRWWGVSIRDNFAAVLSTVQEITLEEVEAVRIVRAFRRLSRVRSRDYSSLTAFIDGAFLLKCLPRLAVPDPDLGHYRATGRRWNGEAFLVWAYRRGLLGVVVDA